MPDKPSNGTIVVEVDCMHRATPYIEHIISLREAMELAKQCTES
jgi:hypothetical protein